MPINILIADSALELVPVEIRRHPAVTKDAQRRKKEPSQILLDRSIHHAAMLRLGDSSKRGRPDLVHSTLLSITATPLYEDRVVKLFVHTLNDVVLEIRAGTRLPKSYFLFRNLIEKALVDKSSTDLVRVYESSLASLVRHVIRPGYVVGLSVQGRPVPLEEMVKTLHDKRNPVVLIGGFPRGHFSIATLKILDNLVRIHERPLQAQTVACRLIYEYEKLDLHTQN